MVLEILRSQYIIQKKYGIEINLLSTIYLLLTLPKVMIVNLNHKLSKKFDVEIIDQCEIQIELNLWVKYEIFGLVVHTPNGVMPCLNSCGYLYCEVQSMTYVIRFIAKI